jgi:hypothetical protein
MRQELRKHTPDRRARTGHPATRWGPHSALRVIPVAWLMGVVLLCCVAVAQAQPANDDIANATPITSLPFDDSLNTTAATMAPDDPDCFGNGPTVWYTFTPTEDVSLFVDAQTDTTYDSTLSVYTGTPGNLTQLTCSDSSIVFEADAGTTYWFMVGSFFSEFGGTLVFRAEVTPPALELDIAVNATGVVDPKTGVARMSGTVRCNTESTIDFVGGSLQQRQGNKAISQGLGVPSFACTPPLASWSDTTSIGPFKKGTAVVVDLQACGCNPISCACSDPQDPITITLGQKAKR